MALKYIYLTHCLGGISGGPSYVNNKKSWQESLGWDVYAFDGYDSFLEPIVFKGLKGYDNNRIKELSYHPFWVKNDINKILNRIISIANYRKDDYVVVESHTQVLSEWGELLARVVKGKHLVFLLGEHVRIPDRETFDFYMFKYKRNEIFSISAKAFDSLFSDYFQISDSENHYWNAKSVSAIEDVNTNLFDCLPPHDYIITQFGRWKAYFPTILPEIDKFLENNKGKKVLLIIVGEGYSMNKVRNFFKEKAVSTLFFKSMTPIPQKLFDVSDVVIATSGCARIAFGAGCKTISMDVEKLKPLGIVGYTTKELAYNRTDENINLELSTLLEDILVKGKYRGAPCFNPFDEPHDYNYQMSFIKSNDMEYYEGPFSEKAYSKKQNVYKFLAKSLGLVSCPLYIDSFVVSKISK